MSLLVRARRKLKEGPVLRVSRHSEENTQVDISKCVYLHIDHFLRREDASAADLLDLLLRLAGEEPGLDDDGRLGQVALAQHLEEPGARDVDDWRLALGLLGTGGVAGARLLAHQRPQLVQVDGGAVRVGHVGVGVEVAHAHLAKVTRVVLVEVDAMVVLTAGVSASSGMLAVLADATVAVGHVAAELAGLLLVGRHAECWGKDIRARLTSSHWKC